MKNNFRKFLIRFLFLLALIGLLSCDVFSTPVAPILTPTLPPVSQSLTLTFTTISETSASPVYTLTAQVPLLADSNDPRVQQFNQQTAALVQQAVDGFKQSLAGESNMPIAMGSFFDLKYSLVSPWSDILSLKFDVDSYHDGAAHPYHYSRAFTFNLATGHQVSLDQLFLPGTNYLQVLSDYCKTELEGRDIAFDASVTGADPLPDNYQSWNISADGLVITFDEYLVAAYAAGPQIVTIPYAELQAMIDSNGPLSIYLQ